MKGLFLEMLWGFTKFILSAAIGPLLGLVLSIIFLYAFPNLSEELTIISVTTIFVVAQATAEGIEKTQEKRRKNQKNSETRNNYYTPSYYLNDLETSNYEDTI